MKDEADDDFRPVMFGSHVLPLRSLTTSKDATSCPNTFEVQEIS